MGPAVLTFFSVFSGLEQGLDAMFALGVFVLQLQHVHNGDHELDVANVVHLMTIRFILAS